jgi:amino acid transporter
MGTNYEVKRDLGRRHINMIAIAGMIVSQIFFKSISPATILTHTM